MKNYILHFGLATLLTLAGCGNQPTKLRVSGGGGNNEIGGLNDAISCAVQKVHVIPNIVTPGVAPTSHEVRVRYTVTGPANPGVEFVRLNSINATLSPIGSSCFDAAGNRLVIATFGEAPPTGFSPLGLSVQDETNLTRKVTCTSTIVEIKDYTGLADSEKLSCAATGNNGGGGGGGVAVPPITVSVSQVGMLAAFTLATAEMGTAPGASFPGEIDFGDGNTTAVTIGAGANNAKVYSHIYNNGTQAALNYTVKVRRSVSGVVQAETTQVVKLLSTDLNPMPEYQVRGSGGLEVFSGAVVRPRPQLPRDVIAIGPGNGKSQSTTVFVYHPLQQKTVLGSVVTLSDHGAPVALGDIDGDGHMDLIAGRYSNDGIVRIVSGKSGAATQFDPFGAGYNTGVWVGTMDTDGDGKHELITGSQHDQVRVFSHLNGAMTLLNGINATNGIKPFGNDDNGMHVAGLGKLMTVMRGHRAGNENPVALFSTFPSLSTFASLQTFSNTLNEGHYVSLGYLDGNASPELVVGTEPGQSGAVQIRSLTFDTNGAVTGSGPATEYVPFAAGFDKGISAAIADVDNDGIGDLITGSGEGTATNAANGIPISTIRIFSGANLTQQMGVDYRPYGTKYVHVFVAGPPPALR